MEFRIVLDPMPLVDHLNFAQQRQLPFAVSLALNRVANLAQKAEQTRLQTAFHLRRESFNLQGIYISKADRATKTSWQVTIQIQANRSYLNRMEQGGMKDPTRGHFLWKPNREVFGDDVIMRSNPLHPSNLHFHSPIHNKGKGLQLQGDNRTFMVMGNGKYKGPLVLQRVAGSAKGAAQRISLGAKHGAAGRDKATGRITAGASLKRARQGGVRLLYTLVSRVTVPAKLEFIDTIGNTVETSWREVLDQAMEDALRSSR